MKYAEIREAFQNNHEANLYGYNMGTKTNEEYERMQTYLWKREMFELEKDPSKEARLRIKTIKTLLGEG